VHLTLWGSSGELSSFVVPGWGNLRARRDIPAQVSPGQAREEDAGSVYGCIGAL
jgi:hypothetical protein